VDCDFLFPRQSYLAKLLTRDEAREIAANIANLLPHFVMLMPHLIGGCACFNINLTRLCTA
jgi:hypothetical protein